MKSNVVWFTSNTYGLSATMPSAIADFSASIASEGDEWRAIATYNESRFSTLEPSRDMAINWCEHVAQFGKADHENYDSTADSPDSP